MGLFNWFRSGPKAATQSKGGGNIISDAGDLERAMRVGTTISQAGLPVTPDTSMRVAAVFACVRIISGAVANMPFQVVRRIDERTRDVLRDHPVAKLIARRPNRWQTPSQFKRMMEAHLMLRGNAYARIVWSRDRPIELIPLHPDRVVARQLDDLTLAYDYTSPKGGRITFAAKDMFHLVGLSLDGVTGVSVITYARESIGLSMAQDRHGSSTFKNQARPSMVLSHPGTLGGEGQRFLQESLSEYRAGGDSEGNALILEEGMTVDKISMTAQDAQWIEARGLSRSDIAMFFGVPPHMIGDTEKSTSWGSGIEQQSIGFVTYTLEDHLTCWEETCERDLMADGPDDETARFKRQALLRGDTKTRTDYYKTMMQWGVFSPNDVLELEDRNPRGAGDIYYPPPNMTAADPIDPAEEEDKTP